MIRTRHRLWLAVMFALAASGCRVDLTLRPDGWCKLRMVYPVQTPTTVAIEKRRFTSPYVRVVSLELRDDKTAEVRAAIRDLSKLPTMQFFRGIGIERVAEGGDERITATFRNPWAREVKDEGEPGPRINATLPGPVREANWNAVVAGDHVRWAFSHAEFARQSRIDFSVRYTPAPAS